MASVVHYDGSALKRVPSGSGQSVSTATHDEQRDRLDVEPLCRHSLKRNILSGSVGAEARPERHFQKGEGNRSDLDRGGQPNLSDELE